MYMPEKMLHGSYVPSKIGFGKRNGEKILQQFNNGRIGGDKS